jgi:hypothetical protein
MTKNFFLECLSEGMLAKLAVAELEALKPGEGHIIWSVETFFKFYLCTMARS